jgi:hypothetical protein
MAAMTCFKANKRRIKAAVDERLMKGFQETTFQNHFFDSFLTASDGVPRRPHKCQLNLAGPQGPSL